MANRYTGMFRLHPIAGSSEDGFVDHDKELIKRSILNLIKTHKGSRVYDPDYGTNLHRLIHEQNIERIRNIAKNEIKDVIEKYEPRAKVQRIEAYAAGEVDQEIVVVMSVLYVEYGDEEVLEMKFSSDQQWISEEGTTLDPMEAAFGSTFK